MLFISGFSRDAGRLHWKIFLSACLLFGVGCLSPALDAGGANYTRCRRSVLSWCSPTVEESYCRRRENDNVTREHDERAPDALVLRRRYLDLLYQYFDGKNNDGSSHRTFPGRFVWKQSGVEGRRRPDAPPKSARPYFHPLFTHGGARWNPVSTIDFISRPERKQGTAHRTTYV